MEAILRPRYHNVTCRTMFFKQIPKLIARFLIPAAFFLAVLFLCVCLGSVKVPLGDSISLLWHELLGNGPQEGVYRSIVLSLRLPRARLWDGTEGAHLYRAVLNLVEYNEVLDETEASFGIRSLLCLITALAAFTMFCVER